MPADHAAGAGPGRAGVTGGGVLPGSSAEDLLAWVDEQRPSLVVMGRTGRSAWRRLLEGSTSRAFATHCAVPVLIVA